jgi:hypothetical protein
LSRPKRSRNEAVEPYEEEEEEEEEVVVVVVVGYLTTLFVVKFYNVG